MASESQNKRQTATAPSVEQQLSSMLQKQIEQKQIEKQSDSEIVQEICSGNLGEEEITRRISFLIKRHPERVDYGLRKIKRGDEQWHRASESLGYGRLDDDDTFRTFAHEAIEYLAEVPEKGKFEGKRRICTFLEDDRTFEEWMSAKLFGLARRIRERVEKEKKLNERQQDIADSGEGIDRHLRRRSEIGTAEQDLARVEEKILAQLEGDCKQTLEFYFHSDQSGAEGRAQERVSEAEKCLRRVVEITRRKGVDLRHHRVPQEEAEAWRCAQKLSGRCQALVLHYFFLGSGRWWEVGRALSENDPEEYESREQYTRAEYDWVRRVRNECKQKVEQQCSSEVADEIRVGN